jgi:hypothetical protein
MFASNFSTWILVALLTPFWWGMGLLVVALLGDLSAWWHVRASRLFNQFRSPLNGLPRSRVVTRRKKSFHGNTVFAEDAQRFA